MKPCNKSEKKSLLLKKLNRNENIIIRKGKSHLLIINVAEDKVLRYNNPNHNRQQFFAQKYYSWPLQTQTLTSNTAQSAKVMTTDSSNVLKTAAEPAKIWTYNEGLPH